MKQLLQLILRFHRVRVSPRVQKGIGIENHLFISFFFLLFWDPITYKRSAEIIGQLDSLSSHRIFSSGLGKAGLYLLKEEEKNLFYY